MPARDGVVLVDKPAGPTSHDVVASARRALGERRVGHAGTLDPFATGLLVLLVGRATRLLPYLDGEPKTYEATVCFGAETDTDDFTGTVTRTAPVPTLDAIVRALPVLTGAIVQRPPAYSAKKVAGRRAYAAARAGAAPDLPGVPVQVHAWAITGWHDDCLDATVVCGGGTYVRALARDLGRRTGSAAHLAALRRVRSGSFDVRTADSLDALRAGSARVLPALDGVRSLAAVTLDAASRARIVHGQPVHAAAAGPRAALVDESGALVAIAERAGDEWRPRVVLADE